MLKSVFLQNFIYHKNSKHIEALENNVHNIHPNIDRCACANLCLKHSARTITMPSTELQLNIIQVFAIPLYDSFWS